MKAVDEKEAEKEEEKSTIEAISGILKLRSSAVGGDAKSPTTAQLPGGKKVTIKETADDDDHVHTAYAFCITGMMSG